MRVKSLCRGCAGEFAEFSIVGVAIILFTAGYAAIIGQDINWDLRNYHFYGGYALLHDRTHLDFAPSQLQSWLNPLLHVLHYKLIKHLSPLTVGIILGGVAGLNGAILYAMCRRLFNIENLWKARGVAALAVLAGVTGPMFLSEIGTTFTDNIASIPVLLALWMCIEYFRGTDVSRNGWQLWLAGAFLGVATGIKLTNALYFLALTAALIILWHPMRMHWRNLIHYVIWGFIGYLITGGYWAFVLWLEYGNPVFPFYNAIFHSPYFESINLTDRRFLPDSVTEAIKYPLQWFQGEHPSAEVPFRDARFLLLTLLLPVTLAATGIRVFTRSTAREHDSNKVIWTDQSRFIFLLVFFSVSYVIWISLWGIHRYMIVLELLTGVMILMCLDHLLEKKHLKVLMFTAIVAFVIGWTRPADWGRLPYTNSWFGVDLATHNQVSGALYVMVGDDPMSYVIPFMPQASGFVRLTGNLNVDPESNLGRIAKTMIETHSGPIFTLSMVPITDDQRKVFAQFGLRVDGSSDCVNFQSRIDRFIVCSLVRRD